MDVLKQVKLHPWKEGILQEFQQQKLNNKEQKSHIVI